MSACRQQLTPTNTLNTSNNPYVGLLLNEFSDQALDESRAPTFKGQWKNFFKSSSFEAVDLEIGTGNGLHFANRAETCPNRLILGIEIKFKPLIQSIRRAKKQSLVSNSVMMRFNAYKIEELFEAQELNNIFIHHPDPWPKMKHWKHRLLQSEYLDKTFDLQKPQSFLEFKTDSKDYFEWATPKLKQSKYEIHKYTLDLHNSEYARDNFVTHFEKIFIKKGQPIYYAQMVKI